MAPKKGELFILWTEETENAGKQKRFAGSVFECAAGAAGAGDPLSGQRGVVSSFDGFTLLLLSEGKQYLIYKHAISTIVPQTKVEPWGSQES